MDIIIICLMAITILLLLVIISQITKKMKDLQAQNIKAINEMRKENTNTIHVALKNYGDILIQSQKFASDNQSDKLERMRLSMDKQMEDIRKTVDEKLQKTLEDKLARSFSTVSERLEQVYKGLGEMQTLASGVGDLKKVLSNVKTRGILGEVQLHAILEQLLTREQYAENIAVVPGSVKRVEFAIKLPGDEKGPVYLPIDAKFPADTYSHLLDAYERGSVEAIKSAEKVLGDTIKREAKSIRDKYIETPYTTDFAIMFLPFEGLYSEVVRSGLVEVLQRDYKVTIAGPTTMAAMLNSLQMGFKTLAIQKRSGEVWSVLNAVKGEFDKFGEVLIKTQERIRQTNDELDQLVGVRTRQIQKRLRAITSPEEIKTTDIFEIEE